MAKKRKNIIGGRRGNKFLKLNKKEKRDILIILFVGLSCLFFLSMINLAGQLGEFLKEYFRYGFGWQAYLIPFILLAVAVFLFKEGRKDKDKEFRYSTRWNRIVGLFLFIISLSVLLHLFYSLGGTQNSGIEGKGGGYLGLGFAYPFLSLAGFWATLFLFFALFLMSLVLVLSLSFSDIFQGILVFKNKSITLFKKVKSKMLLDKGIEVKGLTINGVSKLKKNETTEATDYNKKPTFDMMVRNIAKENQREKEDETLLDLSKNWQPYPFTLLDNKASLPTSGDINKNVTTIRKTFENFGIRVEMQGVNIGPTVTQYTLKPAEGIKLSRIIALQNDLSLALASHPIRIEAPIPGKSLVGIEVPNQHVAIVRFKDILESEEFGKRKSPLTVALGRDVSGNTSIADLVKMPHLLISGATGSGKSICLNSIILSFLYQNSPDSLKLILVDPKKVEMTSYNGVPHLLTPVVTEVDKTINSLKWLVLEMERRLKLFSENNSRDIASYNRKLRQNKLPYLVLVIDELADLMAVAINDVEACIVRLAQMARAAGIHLILATQRPSVNVITGLIKANITSRIAFAVASQIDSRTIIDTAGAEKLLGNGDMLYLNSELGKPRRIQGVYVSEREIKDVTDWIKKQGEPSYKKEVLEKQKITSVFTASSSDVDDKLFDEAQDIVFQAGKASASLLQRRLRIGYARAARLLDILEEKGIVGPADGAKPREILVDRLEKNTENSEENYHHD